jgi:GntR family transcriptional repressor for pyruvate dehydrogenase complex
MASTGITVTGENGTVTRIQDETGMPARRPVATAQPIERRRLLDDVTDRILAHIRDEGLRPGDRLPSNRALSEQFLIATPTLREALRRLEATGAVELRHGSGVYVRADLARLIMVNPNRLRLDRAAILDLLEARELIEPYLAEAAARNATEVQLDELAGGLDRAGQVPAGDREPRSADMSFHRTIGRLAGNRALAQVLESLVDLHDQEQRHAPNRYGDPDHDHRAHQAILAAVRARDPRQAGRLMREHMRVVRRAVSEAVDGPRNDDPVAGDGGPAATRRRPVVAPSGAEVAPRGEARRVPQPVVARTPVDVEPEVPQ